ncbi:MULTISPECIES: hypothetical protein [Actinomadura]|uniref:Uncharacterized protein n=1 Tax=Actinomadura yumaensis TaxID=111807 RepID=A0ABW2CJP9_9ACTN|nr:hypothetical protein [Actinomadura sp. J1-007]
MIGGGAWSDRAGRRVAMLVPSVALLVWAPVFFWLVGAEAAWITELFPTRYRYAGSSLVFQGSSIVAGAPAPFIAVWLVDRFGAGAVIGYLVATMLVTAVALAFGRETRGTDLDAVR